MAYVNLKNTTVDKYDQIIYSGDARYKIKITFNGKELENADIHLEKMVRSSRVLPDDSSKRFTLDNFVAQTIQLTLHDIDTSIIQEPINISLGTLIDSAKSIYEYVPLGVFNIQEKPTTDKGVTTLKLIDNRVKFDTPYDGSVLIKANNGSVTKKQVLDDICKSVGVINDITTFLGEDDKLGIYDNTIKATTYVAYMLEQAGCFAIITREGHLGKVELNNLTTHRIPSSIVEENYSKEKDKNFKVERVVYEDAIRKYDSNTDENVDGSTLQTLYLNAANPYISSQEQVESIYTKLKDFEINSIVTQKVMGNPRIDPWDIIEVYDYYSKADTKPILFRTLANQEMTYTGVLLTTYKTEIGTEAQKENVTISGNAVMKKWARTEIDNVTGTITLQAGKIEETQKSLEKTNDNLSKTQNDLKATNTDLSNTKTDLSNAKSDIATAKNDIATAQKDIASTKTDLATTNDTVAKNKKETDDSIASTNSNLSAAEAELTGRIDATNTTLQDTKSSLSTSINDVNSDLSKQINNTNKSLSDKIDNTKDDIETNLQNNYYTAKTVETMVLNASQGVTNTFSEAGGNNVFRNTGLWFETSGNDRTDTSLYDYWTGKVEKDTTSTDSKKAANLVIFKLKNGTLSQTQRVSNGNYTVSFMYRKTVSQAVCSVNVNGTSYSLTSTTDKEFVQNIVVKDNTITITFTTNTDNSLIVYDIMVNAGTVKLAYSQNQNEVTTDTVSISKGITIQSDKTNTKLKANSDGIRITDRSDNVITDFTNAGIKTKDLLANGEFIIPPLKIIPYTSGSKTGWNIVAAVKGSDY